MITQKELKKLLHYNPDTGTFTWLKVHAKVRIVKAGDVAGTVSAQGYIHIRVARHCYKAHRLAWFYMTGEWPENQIDHINHVRADNRFINLRKATNEENQKNSSVRKDNTSGVTGVYWKKEQGKWAAQIAESKNRINLGYFVDKFEAICARKSAERKHGFHPNHGQKSQRLKGVR